MMEWVHPKYIPDRGNRVGSTGVGHRRNGELPYLDGIGLILTGGAGRRIGLEKALLPWKESTLVSRIAGVVREVFSETYLVGFSHPPAEFGLDGVGVINEAERIGPLGALLSAFEATSGPRVFVVACDMPFIRPWAIRTIWAAGEGSDLAVPAGPDGLHPMFATYSRSCLPVIRRYLDRGNRRLDAFFPEVDAKYVATTTHPAYWKQVLRNLNTRDEYLEAYAQVHPDCPRPISLPVARVSHPRQPESIVSTRKNR